jgi:hypothetical protein
MGFVGLAMATVRPVATAVLDPALGIALLAPAVSRTLAAFLTLPATRAASLDGSGGQAAGTFWRA